jgi:hypothetical protein
MFRMGLLDAAKPGNLPYLLNCVYDARSVGAKGVHSKVTSDSEVALGNSGGEAGGKLGIWAI